MKILVMGGKKPPHLLTQQHIRAIKRLLPSANVVAGTSVPAAARACRDADVIAGFPWQISSLPLMRVKQLKWIHSFSAGVDRLLLPGVVPPEALLSNSSGIHAIPIAEHLIGFMLLFTRKFHTTLHNQQNKNWKGLRDITELHGKTVLIVGLGAIGEETARLAHAFGCKVIAVARRKRQAPRFVHRLVTASQLDAMLPKADFVVVTLPHTNETHHLFNMAKFRIMKPTAVIINIGRGPIIHERDLVQALKKKLIAGAALDVTETEPLPKSSPLWRMENVVITPHHSGLSEKYMDRAIERFCLNLRAFLLEKPLPNLVDKKLGY